MKVMAQIAMVMNLDKCIGCHACLQVTEHACGDSRQECLKPFESTSEVSYDCRNNPTKISTDTIPNH